MCCKTSTLKPIKLVFIGSLSDALCTKKMLFLDNFSFLKKNQNSFKLSIKCPYYFIFICNKSRKIKFIHTKSTVTHRCLISISADFSIE